MIKNYLTKNQALIANAAAITRGQALDAGRQIMFSTMHIAGVHYTGGHTGKMSGLFSLSTNWSCNAQCLKNSQVPGSICEKCFAKKHTARCKNNVPALTNNYNALNSRILEYREIPIINSPSGLFRFEAFGDVASDIQAFNYLLIALFNPWIKCAAWTKNPKFYDRAIAALGFKPANFRLVVSSLFINKPLKSASKNVDTIFTVYDRQFVASNNIDINCGAKSCATCRACYEGNTRYINELLKSIG